MSRIEPRSPFPRSLLVYPRPPPYLLECHRTLFPHPREFCLFLEETPLVRLHVP